LGDTLAAAQLGDAVLTPHPLHLVSEVFNPRFIAAVVDAFLDVAGDLVAPSGKPIRVFFEQACGLMT
jgi:hypothetical protein